MAPAAATAADRGSAAAPPETDGALYTWYDRNGVPHLAARVQDIPKAARAHVVVARPGGGPEAALADDRVIADFSGGTPSFSRVDLSRIARSEEVDGATLLRHRRVYLYSTTWCGYCKKAKAYLTGLGVRFVEQDIEANGRAAAEMKAKAEAAGVRVRGVPVLDVHGTLIPGFDRAALDAALVKAGYEVADAPAP